MLLPLSLLKCAQNSAVLIELKSGESYNGHLVSVDSYMNIHLRDAICTSKDGDRFHRIPEVFIRGPQIKVFRLSPEALIKLREDNKNLRQNQRQNKTYKKQLNRAATGQNPAQGNQGQGKKRAGGDSNGIPNKVARGDGGAFQQRRGRGR